LFPTGKYDHKFEVKRCCMKHTCAPEVAPSSSSSSSVHMAMTMRKKRSKSMPCVEEMMRAFSIALEEEGHKKSANAYRIEWLQQHQRGGGRLLPSSGMNGYVDSTWGPVQYAAATSVLKPVFTWKFNVKTSHNVYVGTCENVYIDCVMMMNGAADFRLKLSCGGDDDGDRGYFDRWMVKYGTKLSDAGGMGVTYLVIPGADPLDVQRTLMHVHRLYGFFVSSDDDSEASAPHRNHAVFRLSSSSSSSGTALAISTECLRRYRMLTLQYQPFSQSTPKAPLLTQFWTLKARPRRTTNTASLSSASDPAPITANIVAAADKNVLDLTRRFGMLAVLEFIVSSTVGQLENMRERMYGVHEPYFKIYELLPDIIAMHGDLKAHIWNSVVLRRLECNTFFPMLVHFICQRSSRAEKSMGEKFTLRSFDLSWMHGTLFFGGTERCSKLSARYPYAKYLLRHMVSSGSSNGKTYTEISIPLNDWSRVKMPGTLPLPPRDCPLVYFLYELVGETELLSLQERAKIFSAIIVPKHYSREPRFVGALTSSDRSNVPKKSVKLMDNYDRFCTKETTFPREQRYIPFTQLKRKLIDLDALYLALLGLETVTEFCPVDPDVARKHYLEGDPDASKVWIPEYNTTGIYGLTRIIDPVHLATHQTDMAVGCRLKQRKVEKMLMFEESLYVHKAKVNDPCYAHILDAYVLVRDPTLLLINI